MPLPYKPELPYKPTNTGDVPAKHTATTLPRIYDRESQVTVAQRNRNRGWPACPTWLIEGEARECHGDHGRCTHMGVCACDRGFAGDACEVRTCPLKCSGHGVCVPGGDTPDCACDAGYGGRSCNEKLKHHHHAAPKSIRGGDPRWGAEAAALPHNLTVAARLGGLPPDAVPLAPLLPAGGETAYLLAANSEPPELLAVDLRALRVATSRPLGHPADGRPAAALQPATTTSSAHAASAVDWAGSFAYVGTREGAAPAVVQVALPSLRATATRALPATALAAQDVTALALAAQGAPSNGVGTILFAVLGAFGGAGGAAQHTAEAQAELVVLRIPEMQPLHSTRFRVPSAVTAAHFDPQSGWLYLLSAGARPRLFKSQMTASGAPTAPVGVGDALKLPWAAALPHILAFPSRRALVVVSAPPPGEPTSACRIALGVPLDQAVADGDCRPLKGALAAEAPLSAVADDIGGAAYLGCRSGAVVRLTLSPFRLDASVRAAAGPIAHAVLRAADGGLWVGAEMDDDDDDADGGGEELLALTTRQRAAFGLAPPDALRSPAPPPPPAPPPVLTEAHADAAEVPTLAPGASFLFPLRWKLPNLRRAAAAAPPLPSPPPPPPPRPPPPLQLRAVPGARAGGSGVWLVSDHSSTGVTVVLLVAAVVGGSLIGSRLYRLWAACFRRPNARSGYTRLPGT